MAGALIATSAENKGESAITAIPQTKRKMTSSGKEPALKNNGEAKQQRQDKPSASMASFLVPINLENIPLKIQAGVPEAIIRKENKDTLK